VPKVSPPVPAAETSADLLVEDLLSLLGEGFAVDSAVALKVIERLTSLGICKLKVFADLSEWEVDSFWAHQDGSHLDIAGPGESRVLMKDLWRRS
jgi:hypothetical protein